MGRTAQDLETWLEPFLAALRHKKRRTWSRAAWGTRSMATTTMAA